MEDLDYADDVGLLSHRHQNIQQKIEHLSQAANTIGLRVNEKTKVMRTNTTNNNLIRVNDKILEGVEEFVYLGSKLSIDGDCHQEINATISKVNQAYAMLRSIWRASGLSIHTKL